MKNMKHVSKLAIILLDLLQQVHAEKDLLDASNILAPFQRRLDLIQVT